MYSGSFGVGEFFPNKLFCLGNLLRNLTEAAENISLSYIDPKPINSFSWIDSVASN